MAVVVARCYAFVGEDLPRDAHFAIGNFIRDALEGDMITVQSDGTPTRSYLHQADLAEWLLTLVARGHSGRVYNVGSDQAITMRDLAALVAEELRPGIPVRFLGAPRPARPGDRYVPSIDRARQELGLEVKTSLAEAIRRSAAVRRPA
jgi:dTDP-glucose 4,6-dehydratase